MIAVLLVVFGLTPDYISPVSAGIPIYLDYDPQKTAGKWHPIGMASTLPELTDYEQKISSMDHTVKVTGGGNLKFTTNYMNGVCKVAAHKLKRTKTPGVFKFPKGFVHMIDMDYGKYLIMHVKFSTHEAMFLSARGSDVGDDIKAKFRKLVLEQKYPKEYFTYFKNAEQCTPKAG
ncbi:epididymal secretory protein 4-like [Zootoca vivipara]|uniref:epididymal secretory protein 4-like n=1 Tax=Zootoca vivipara TaxID=8524 RepID=UPI0015923F97|nr:epididymal secretory protein 4-like [Zootoca vivipara]